MLRIYGKSDDLTIIDGDVSDEGAVGDLVTVGTERTGGLSVRMRYPGPTWRAAVEQLGEYVPIPWPVTISEAPWSETCTGSYSVMVTIDCPPGTPVRIGERLINPPVRP